MFKILDNAKHLVGHSVQHDFDALDYKILNETDKMAKVRDVAKYPKYKSGLGQAKSLKKLADEFLSHSIQTGQHDSVVDARAALALYRINERDWENTAKQKSYTD